MNKKECKQSLDILDSSTSRQPTHDDIRELAKINLHLLQRIEQLEKQMYCVLMD